MSYSVSSTLLWRGPLAIAVGVVSVAWPNISGGELPDSEGGAA